MLIIFFIWLYLGVTFLNVGFAFKKLLGIKDLDTSLTLIFGMFTITLLASFWAVFGRINFEFQLLLLFLQLVVIGKYQQDLRQLYSSLYLQVKQIRTILKVFFLLFLVMVLFQSSSSSIFIDNETYYIQTIKWLNEYGFVPGLANLHIFFGQTSGWHILQSVFSFSYFNENCNDLNGFCLLLGIAFSINSLHEYFKTENFWDLNLGILPLAVVFLIPFSNVPSPDLTVIIFSILLFYYFIKFCNESNSDALTILSLLALFVLFIKISALPISLIPVFYFASNSTKNQTKIVYSLLLVFVVFLLFVVKNTILTGYPLYPSSLLADYFSSDNSIPKVIYDFWWNEAKNYDFIVSQKEYFQLSSFEIFVKWITHSWITRFFTIAILSILIIVPFILKKIVSKKSILILYWVMILQLLFLIVTTPQYRFVLSFVVFFGLLLVSLVLSKKNTIYSTLFLSLIVSSYFILFPKPISQNHNRINFKPTTFTRTQSIIPQSNSNLNTQYSLNSKGNLDYFSPGENTYIWVTGNGKLPCVNSQQIDYIEQKLGYIPQLKGKTLAEGFYSKKVK